MVHFQANLRGFLRHRSTTTATSPNDTNNTSPKSRLDKHRSITVDTIIAWTDEILAWHHTDRASNGRIEGTNNLALRVSVG